MPVRVVTVIILAFLATAAFAQPPVTDESSGEVARRRGDFSAATQIFRTTGLAAELSGDKQTLARSQLSLGHVYYLQARYTEAVGAFRKAEMLGDGRTADLARAFLGQLYWRVGKVDDADLLLDGALEAFTAAGDDLNIALTLRFKGRRENGRVVNGRPNNAEALKLYERSLAISRRIGDEEGELTTLKEIGLLYQTDAPTAENYEKARGYFEDLRARLRGTDYRRLYAVVLNNLATNAKLRRDLDRSLEYAAEGIALFREMGDLQELREMINTRIAVLSDLPDRFAETGADIDESIAISKRLYDQQIGDPLDAQRYFESLIHGFRMKIELADHLDRPDKMIEAQEAMRSWAMLERLQMPADTSLSAADRSAESEFVRTLETLDKEIARAKTADDAKSLENRRRQARLAYEEWQAATAMRSARPKPDDLRTLNIADMCRTLPDERTAIVKFENTSRSPIRVFVLTRAAIAFENQKNRRSFHRALLSFDGKPCSLVTYYAAHWANADDLARLERIHRAIGDFRQQITGRLPSYKSNARFLYDELLADALDGLKGVDHLVIMPSGNLTRVPFQSLVSKQDRFVIEDFAVSYAPSISVLAQMREKSRLLRSQEFPGGVLALGNSKLTAETSARFGLMYGDGGLADLPEAELESRAIAKLFPSSRAVVGPVASESLFRSETGKFRFLHLAVHGLSNEEKPQYSQLLLAPDAGADGLLEGREIARMNLRSEMAVLSACESALGRELDGEGMVGLAWAFAAAGVPTVVASGWKVESKATADLMIDFYSDLAKDNAASKARSLQTAAIKRLRDPRTRHPFYWAAFSLNGAW